MNRILTYAGALLAALLLATTSMGAEEPLQFDSPEQEARFNDLASELRCLVCQNQTLSDSDAPLAQDLRSEIFAMMAQGKSDDEIKAFMVERYGDFVLYRPPLQTNTLVLWLAPLLLLAVGGLVTARAVRRRAAQLEAEEAAEDSEGQA